jgi:hypothetical protein
MSRFCWSVLAFVLAPAVPALAQMAPASPQPPQAPNPLRSEIYHVHFTQAAPGKSAELEKILATPAPGDVNPGHALVFRHAQGSPWDFAVIQHIGPKATVEITPSVSPARELRAWHDDTFAAGPSWAVFSKAMGIDGAPGQGPGNAVYVVSTYRGAPGHRTQLDETLGRVQAAAMKPEQGVVLQHVEGGNWDFLAVHRYDSWQALANEESDPAAAERGRRAGLTRSGGLELREHIGAHSDTLAVRVPLQPAR